MATALLFFSILTLAGVTALPMRREGKLLPLEPACLGAAKAAGDLLNHLVHWVSEPSQDADLQDFAKVLAGFDVFNQTERIRVLCQFTGFTDIEGLSDALSQTGLDRQAFKIAYDFFSILMPVVKQYNYEKLAESRDMKTLFTILTIEKLQKTGFLDIDPAGTEALLEYSHLWMPMEAAALYEEYIPLPLSEKDLEIQGRLLTDDIRHLWNAHIEEESKWNPNASEELRETVREWTGVTIWDHDFMNMVIYAVLKAGLDVEPGLVHLFDLFKWVYVVDSVIRTGYLHSVVEINAWWSYLEADSATDDMGQAAIRLFQSLSQMGLLSLDTTMNYYMY